MHRTGMTELEVVLAVARRSSFRGAAQELGMSTTCLLYTSDAADE